MENLEEKLKMENEILSLKRELKNVLAQTTSAKNEYNAIVGLIEDNKKLLEEEKIYLQTVRNDISLSKISWAQEQNQAFIDLESKKSEADNVLKRKSELNTQEETIRQEETKNQEILNETHRVEFKNEQEKTAIEVEKNKIKNRELDIERREEKLLKDKENFKEKVVGVLKEAENI